MWEGEGGGGQQGGVGGDGSLYHAKFPSNICLQVLLALIYISMLLQCKQSQNGIENR